MATKRIPKTAGRTKAKPAAPAPASKPPPAAAAKRTAKAPAAAPRPAKARTRAASKKGPPPAPEPAPAPEQDPAALAKLNLGPEAAALEPTPATIPWSYGQDRVTAAAVDPDRLYVYWEVTDEAIERARAALGPGGPGAWLDLRVYDTSGMIFDGISSNGYFDHGLDRTTRQWFFHVGKPTSSAVVEVGLKSDEGYFARIARSGRVDFPRREPAPWHDPEWMTVRPWTGEVADVHRAPVPAGRQGPPKGGPAMAPPRFEQIPLWTMREAGESWEAILRQALEQGFEHVEWHEVSGEGWFALEGRVEWESPRVVTSWEAGPFSYPVEVEPPSREEWAGRAFAFRVGGVTHVVYGPWRVVIRNLGGRAEHATHGAWVIYRSWNVEGGQEVLRPGRGRLVTLPGGSEQVMLGASEQRWQAASELRLAGASERWRAGASEVAYQGASERLFLGASQQLARGASERMVAGASERRLGGASERGAAGGSEARLGGASERLRAGGSEQRIAPEPDDALPYPAIQPARSAGEE